MKTHSNLQPATDAMRQSDNAPQPIPARFTDRYGEPDTDFSPPPHPVHALVHVNHFYGRIRRVHTHAHYADPKQPDTTRKTRLSRPIYDIELDTTRKRPWVVHARQVHIAEGQRQIRLFEDEFDLVNEW